MKKIRNIAAILLVCAICLTGCMRINATITVKPDGKMDVSMLTAMTKMGGLGDTEGGLTLDQQQNYTEDGWTIEEYNQDNYYGFLISKKDLTPEEASKVFAQSQTEIKDTMSGFEVTKEGLKYIIDWTWDDTNTEKINLSEYADNIKALKGYATLTINLPVKPLKSNATIISNNGKTHEWDLLAMGNAGSIHLEFMLINIGLIIAIVAAVLAVIALIVVLIVLLKKRSKKIKVPVVHLQPVDDANSMSWGGMLSDMDMPLDTTGSGKAGETVEPVSPYEPAPEAQEPVNAPENNITE